MTFQYINKVVLFHKVIKKAKTKPNYIYYLLVVYKNQPCKWYELFLKMKAIKRASSLDYFNTRMKELVKLDLIIRDENKLYSLTPSGLSLLKDVETRLRKERHDK